MTRLNSQKPGISDLFRRSWPAGTIRLPEDWLYWTPGFEGRVIALGIGIAAYFALPMEPSLWILAIVMGLALILWQICERRDIRGQAGLLILFCLALGGLRGAWHTHSLNSVPLPAYERSYNVTGWVSAVQRSGAKGERIILHNLGDDTLPDKLRIRLTRAGQVKAGETVNLRAVLSRPPGAIVPGGYDPARKAYFDGIGGFGFAVSVAEVQPDAVLRFIPNVQRGIVRWREAVAKRVMARAPPETAGLQTALLTGLRRHIPPEQTESLRVSGLAHILAISGLHMGLLAGGSFGAATLLLACIWPLSRRMDIRKPAAMIGMVAATLYLILSGASVATERAYIMAMIVFLAVILDRRALSLRSVAVAAAITLWLHPESLVSVGFQMSFAAVTALVVVYRVWQDHYGVYRRRSLWGRFISGLSSLSVTSFVAGLATGGFALFHFGRFARFGLVGNLIAMPLFTFAVMPLAVVSLIAMPLGWEALPLEMMGAALSQILRMSDWVASWPGALGYVGGAPGWVLALYGLGFAVVLVAKGWSRAFGGVMIALAFLGWAHTPQPDFRISETAQLAIWQDGELLVERVRTDRYGRSQFARRGGQPDAPLERFIDKGGRCDPLACQLRVHDRVISVIHHPSEVGPECDVADLVILTERRAGPVARRGCQATLIDETDLARSGALDGYFEGADIRLVQARNPKIKRPWSLY